MKHRSKLIAIILLVLLLPSWRTVYAQSRPGSFTWQNPVPQGNTLNNICLVTDSFFVAVGEMGTVVRSTDQGATWSVTPKVLGSSATLRSVDFVSRTEGWIAGDSSTVLHTTDGGDTWTRSVPADGGFMVKDIRFLNPMVGWACGTSESGFLWKTTDGGANWTTIEDFDMPFQQIMYLKDSVVMLFESDGEIQMSVDSGKTWLADGRGVTYKVPGEMSVVNPNGTIWGLAEGVLERSTDGGSTWQEGGPEDISATSVSFIDAAHGWAASDDVGEVYMTADSGATWKRDTIFSSSLSFTTMNRIRMRASGVGMLVGIYGLMATTNDSGRTWHLQATENGFGIGEIQFLSPLEGWAAGGRIHHTTDGGATWITSQTNYRANTLSFSSPLCGWIGCDVGVWRTRNGGADWSQCASGSSISIAALDSQNVWCGTHSNLTRTTDGGNHWTTIMNHSISSIQFLNADTGWVVNYDWSSDSSVFRTSNGGQTWQCANLDHPISLRFVSPTTGCAGGTSGRIWKTTDGGATWSLKHGPTTESWYMHRLAFSSPMVGWAVGYIGNGLGDYILHTTDGGETWAEVPSISNNGLFSVCFVNDSTGWVGGLDGEMMKIYYPPEGAEGVVGRQQVSPRVFWLGQNYPNPFNPTTEFEFRIVNFGLVTLRIYDVLGREVATLVNGVKEPGEFTVSWDGGGMPSGVYFYRLREEPAGAKGTAYEAVRKMMLLK
ncbi:MAG: YCF48-related protein [Bacteroidota bacterium]|jgi:photosystem II stability/assembly factor-like uncharacterized protein